MTLLNALKFKHIDRGFDKNLIFIPGWAVDYQVFESIQAPYNYVFALDADCDTIKGQLIEAIRSLGRVSLFGWSMGASIASQVCDQIPEFIDQVFLVSLRPKYPDDSLENIKRMLNRNHTSYLHAFYGQCFSGDPKKEELRKYLFDLYSKKISKNTLISGIDYLKRTRIESVWLNRIKKIKFIHGADDLIAPIDLAREFSRSLPQSEFIALKQSGHVPFLNQGFGQGLW